MRQPPEWRGGGEQFDLQDVSDRRLIHVMGGFHPPPKLDAFVLLYFFFLIFILLFFYLEHYYFREYTGVIQGMIYTPINEFGE